MADKTAIIKEAQKYLARGQIDKAIIEWEKLVAVAPDANTFNTIGDLYLRKGDRKSAVENFHQAAKVFISEGFSLKALALHKKIININPADADALNALGELSEEKGLITDAIKYYLSAADLLAKESEKDRFLGIYEKILSLAPLNIPLRDKVAGLFLKEGLSSHAIREYLHIAEIFSDRGDLIQAREYFGKVLEIQPNHRRALIGISSAYERSGNLEQAIHYARKTIAAHPDDAESLRRCAVLLRDSGTYDEAISCLSRVIELNPIDIEALQLIGDLYRQAGDRERAWEAFEPVIEAFASENRFTEAISLAREFRDLDPLRIGQIIVSLCQQDNDLESVYSESCSVGDLLLERGLTEEAVTAYREALKIRPDDTRLKKKLVELEIRAGAGPSAPDREKTIEDLLTDADIFLKYGLMDDARAILEDLRGREPEQLEVHRRLKAIYVEAGDLEQAVTECLILAELYSRAGEVVLREEVLSEARAISPDDPRLHAREAPEAIGQETVAGMTQPADLDDYSEEIAEAEFYLRQGLTQDALRIYQRLLTLFPDNEELRGKVEGLQGEGAVSEAGPEPEQGEIKFDEFTLPETVEAAAPAEPQLDSDVLDIFEEFKKGIEKELEAEDYETHYNLGIAYKEMGLIDDAIKEFQTSRKDKEHLVRSLSMLGICYIEKGLPTLAVDAFRGAVAAIPNRDESYWGAKYDLAVALEQNGDYAEALHHFSEIYGHDSKFREVSEKLNHLKPLVEKAGDAAQPREKKNRVSYL